MIRQTYHRLLLLGALAMLATTLGVFGRARFAQVRTVKFPPAESFPIPSNERAELTLTTATHELWLPTKNEPADGWKFELFTPPPISRDPDTNRFKLNRRIPAKPDAQQRGWSEAISGDGERDNEPEPRFHLLGYIQRDGGEVAGIFQNLETSEVCVTASGPLLNGWHAGVESVELEAAQVANDSLLLSPRARAQVYDELLKCAYTLSTEVVCDGPAPVSGENLSADVAISVAGYSDREP